MSKNIVNTQAWIKHRIGMGILLVMFSGAALAESAAPVSPDMQQQLVDEQKKVLKAEGELLAAQKKHIEEKDKLFDEKESEVLSYTSIGTFLGLMLGLFGGWGFIIWKARDWVTERVNNEINNNLKHLTRIVDNSRLETRLKDEKHLLVLYGENCSNLDSVLRRFGFTNTDAMPCPPDYKSIETNKWDEIIFDNINETVLKTYLDSKCKSWYLAYKTGLPYSHTLVQGATLTLANNQVTLYPRLMELLIWRHSQESKAA